MSRPWRRSAPARLVGCKAYEGDGSLVPLGLDFLTFLATTVLVIPVFKSVKASPILGCALSQHKMVIFRHGGLFIPITYYTNHIPEVAQSRDDEPYGVLPSQISGPPCLDASAS